MKNKILIISSEFPPGPGGIGNHGFNISNELTKRGYRVIINTISGWYYHYGCCCNHCCR